MVIAFDVNGGDFAPSAALDGCFEALSSIGDNTQIRLFGDENAKKLFDLKFSSVNDKRVSFVLTGKPLEYDIPAAIAIRKRQDSSLVRAIQTVADGDADCVVSAGNTGALLSGATLIIKRIEGIKRPALVTLLPTLKEGHTVLLDSGANTDCKPEYLAQFGIMGMVYAKETMGIDCPRVALLNNGTEEGKGNELSKKSYQMLKEHCPGFSGNCEARDVLSGKYDVVVADGFDGNVVLKSIEGTASTVFALLKKEIYSSFICKIGALLIKPAFRAIKRKMDPSEVGGAPLLGVNGGVIKAHGNSNTKAFMNALLLAERVVESRLTERTKVAVAELGRELVQVDKT